MIRITYNFGLNAVFIKPHGKGKNHYSVDEIIFNHDFLKVVFGETTVCRVCGAVCETWQQSCSDYGTILNYEFHSTQLALLPTLKERIKYLEENV